MRIVVDRFGADITNSVIISEVYLLPTILCSPIIGIICISSRWALMLQGVIKGHPSLGLEGSRNYRGTGCVKVT